MSRPPDPSTLPTDAWTQAALAWLDATRRALAEHPPPPERLVAVADTVLVERSDGGGLAWHRTDVGALAAAHDPSDALSREAAHTRRLHAVRRSIAAWDGRPLGPALLCSLHAALQPAAAGCHAPGSYKVADNQAVLFDAARRPTGAWETVGAADVAAEVERAFADAGRWLDELHPLLAVAGLECRLLWVHPFADGNGRTVRALSSVLLRRLGYGFEQWVGVESRYTGAVPYTRAFLVRLVAAGAFVREAVGLPRA